MSKMKSFPNNNMSKKQIKPFKIGQYYKNINKNIYIKINIKKVLSSFSISSNKYAMSQQVFISSKSTLDNTRTS